MRDKKVFLLDKDNYSEKTIEGLTEKDLEKWVAEEDYNDNYTIVKIDANDYNTIEEALREEMPFVSKKDYHIVSFGF